MTELLAALIGIIAGALATGAVQTFLSRRELRLRRQVAARLLLTDVIFVQNTLDDVRARNRWPDDLPTFEREYDVWVKHREAFAAHVDVDDWTYVAAAYDQLAHLGRTAPRGELRDFARRNVEEFGETLDAAYTILRRHTATPRELRRSEFK